MPSADRIKTAHSAHHGPTFEYHSPGCAATGAQVTVNDVRHLSPSVHQPVPQVRRQKCRPHINALQLVRPEPRELQRARAFDARIGPRGTTTKGYRATEWRADTDRSRGTRCQRT